MKAYPGAPKASEQIQEMIRVNHAGEYGAQRIYQGQLAILKNDACASTLRHMAEQEKEHLETFEQLIRDRRVRPSALMPFWHVGGWALGAATALLGKEAAMACTVAVEKEIAAHYKEQEEALDETEAELKSTIERFRAEEEEHHDIGVENDAANAPLSPLLQAGIGLLTKTAVALAKKV